MIGFQPKAKKKSAASAESAQSPAQAQALNQAPDSIPGMFKPGEFVLPPDTVHAMGGKEALNQMVDATHTPAPAAAVVPRGFKPEVFFANGGAPEDQTRKNSFGDAAAASLDSRVNQIPTGGAKAPAPDGRSDTELSRNVNNSLNAMAGMGVVSSVPLRQPPASTALATIPPAAGFTPGALAKIGELKAAAAPQAAQAARGLPGTNAALQQGAQANAYAAAGRTLGGASAGATALDNNRSADPMAQPKVNSFGDASAVARGSSAALPSAAALSMGTAPRAAPQASPQVTTPEARKAVGLFPYSSPDAGANIYAGFGLGKGGEQQAAGAAPQVTTPDPMAAHNQKLEAAQGLQSWRQSQGTSSSPAARQNYLDLQQKAVDMQPSYFAQQGPMAAQARAAAESAASSALQSMYTQKPPAAASAPATNPYASATPEQGRDMAEINAKAQSPMAVMPAAEQQPTGGGITRIDRPGHSPLFTDNKDPDMARFLARPAGGPTKEVSDIMQRMSDKSQNEAFGRFQKEANAAQYTREIQQAQATNAAAGQHARTVQNRMDQEKNLRKLDIKVSSAGSRIERMAAQKAYNEALAQDAGFRAGADAGSVARTQNEGSSARERMQQTGATERAQAQEAGTNARFDQTQGLAQQKFGMEQEAQGFTVRAAAQQEQLRNVLLDPNATPEQRKLAQRSLSALSGKTAADRMQTVTLPDTTNEMGQTVRGGQALVRTLEDGTVEQVPIGAQQQGAAQPLPQDPSKRKAGDVYTAPNGTLVKWDGKGLVPAQ